MSKNEVRIKPLLEYEVFFNEEGHVQSEKFTADGREYDHEANVVRFFRTGNVIREYFAGDRLRKIIVTPVDA